MFCSVCSQDFRFFFFCKLPGCPRTPTNRSLELFQALTRVGIAAKSTPWGHLHFPPPSWPTFFLCWLLHPPGPQSAGREEEQPLAKRSVPKSPPPLPTDPSRLACGLAACSPGLSLAWPRAGQQTRQDGSAPPKHV